MAEEPCTTCETLRTLLFTAWAWLVFAVLAPTAWVLGMLAPSAATTWQVLKIASRLALWATATPVVVHGADRWQGDGDARVLICNHASYLDVLVLMAVLPRPLSFVAKAELGRSWLTRLPLARIGTLFVERFDARRGLNDFRRITAVARRGRSLLFFAEGTFRAEPGLRPFQMGAFYAAVAAGLPVVPVTLKGVRAILPSGTLRPRPGRITVTFGAPLAIPEHRDRRAAAAALKAATRESILAALDEPDLERTPLPAAFEPPPQRRSGVG